MRHHILCSIVSLDLSICLSAGLCLSHQLSFSGAVLLAANDYDGPGVGLGVDLYVLGQTCVPFLHMFCVFICLHIPICLSVCVCCFYQRLLSSAGIFAANGYGAPTVG